MRKTGQIALVLLSWPAPAGFATRSDASPPDQILSRALETAKAAEESGREKIPWSAFERVARKARTPQTAKGSGPE